MKTYIITAIIVWLATVSTVIYVATHFIMKFW